MLAATVRVKNVSCPQHACKHVNDPSEEHPSARASAASNCVQKHANSVTPASTCELRPVNRCDGRQSVKQTCWAVEAEKRETEFDEQSCARELVNDVSLAGAVPGAESMLSSVKALIRGS